MILLFDTETTGLPKDFKAPVSDLNNWPRLVQIAWLIYDDMGNRLSGKDYIIKPDAFTIPAEAEKIHGISTAIAVSYGANLLTVLEEFAQLIKDANYIVAHNMSFDEKIIGAEFLRKNMDNVIECKKKICTKESTTNFCALPDNKWPTLAELHCKLFNKHFDEAHNAATDIIATAKCFWELKKRGVIKLPTQTGIGNDMANELNEFIGDFFSDLMTDLEGDENQSGYYITAQEYQEYKCIGEAKFNEQDYKGAITYFDKTIEAYPFCGYSYYMKALANDELENYKQAIQDYDKAIELNLSDYVQCYYNQDEIYAKRGCAKFNLDDFIGAVCDFDKVIKNNPNSDVTYFNRGKAYDCLYEYTKAINDYGMAIELNSHFSEAYHSRGFLLATKMKDYYGAIDDFDKAIKLTPNKESYYFHRGLSWSLLGDDNEAITNYDMAIEINPKYTLAFYMRSSAKLNLCDYIGTITDCTIAIEINPRCGEAFYYRGLANLELGQKNKAYFDLGKAGNLGIIDAYYYQKKCQY